jgi:hypothetical protein
VASPDPVVQAGLDPERHRLAEAATGVPWRRWGPYLPERQWGTVREDYSPDGSAWTYLPHDHARSRAYRWGEDGLLGICDETGTLCFALALWNETDPILKERLFGLTNPEGNHGEDVKEAYWYLDATPTASYLWARYRYPQDPFPYEELVTENRRRTRADPEFELMDTGIFAAGRFFDVDVEYAKAAPEDLLIVITVVNQGSQPAPIHVLPTLWFRNTWAWGRHQTRPVLTAVPGRPWATILAEHPALGRWELLAEGDPVLLFTDNETNRQRLWGVPNEAPYVKDGIHRAVVEGESGAVNPAQRGTKAAAHYQLSLPAGGHAVLRLRLRRVPPPEPDPPADPPDRASITETAAPSDPFADHSHILARRRAEADAFYAPLGGPRLTAEERRVMRAALAGLVWNQLVYHYNVDEWLTGDPAGPSPPPERRRGRNADWRHLDQHQVVLVPDRWEFPWYAAWDLAFQAVALSLVDPDRAKDQLLSLTRPWVMHPNGQLPAYEWNFSDVNPPVQAWAAWRVYKIEGRLRGQRDRDFLARIFHALLLNFTWWVNRKDPDGRNVFQAGFLGLDNVGVFDRSGPLPIPGRLGQADGTSWMGAYALTLLAIAVELAQEDRSFEDLALKFFEHFLAIAGALNGLGTPDGLSLWDEEDGFFYDTFLPADGSPPVRLRVRSTVGLVPLLAVEVLAPEQLERLPVFAEGLHWFLAHRPAQARLVPSWIDPGVGARRLLALLPPDRLQRVLRRVLDPEEFLSPYGVRSLSRAHRRDPFVLRLGNQVGVVDYEPGEARTAVFGGNSNWRGPVWFPINVLLIEALQRLGHYFGPRLEVECPTGSGRWMSLDGVAAELSRRLIALFLPGPDGRRPSWGGDPRLADDPRWRDLLLFHEYYDGDTGRGLGASHQTGWTALVAKLIDQQGRRGP